MVGLISLGMGAVVDKYPPELGYWHNIPKNYAQKTVTVIRPAGASASGTGSSAGAGSFSSGSSSSSSGGSEESYTEQVVSAPIHVPEKYTESVFVPDGEYYTAKTADGQTVYYNDPENRPFVDGGLDDISHHEG